MYYICIIYVLYMYYMYYICIICVLYVFLLALSGFSWVFCVRGVFCLCFCWLYVAFLGFFASAGFFVRVFAGFIWLFLGFLRPRGFLSVFLLALSGFSWVFCVRGDICMAKMLIFHWFYKENVISTNKMLPKPLVLQHLQK